MLVRNPDSKRLFVNFDTQILELVYETRYMSKLQLEVPEAALYLMKKETEIKEFFVK